MRLQNKTCTVGKRLGRKLPLSWWASPVWALRCPGWADGVGGRVASGEASFIAVSAILGTRGHAGWSPRCCRRNPSPPHLLAFKPIYRHRVLMHLSAFEWLNVLDWQGELINWFLLSNCSRTLMAFELTVTTRGEKKSWRQRCWTTRWKHLFNLQQWSEEWISSVRSLS